MEKSSLMHVVGKASWVLTALAAINVGLCPFGVDLFKTGFMMGMPGLGMALHYLFLAAGVLSLVMFFMACSSECCSSCDTK